MDYPSKALRNEGIDTLWSLMQKIFHEERMPDSWRESTLIPIFKEKGDVQAYENYRGIKLVSHTLKLFERIMDGRIRQEVNIGKQQMGFMEEVGTTEGTSAERR